MYFDVFFRKKCIFSYHAKTVFMFFRNVFYTTYLLLVFSTSVPSVPTCTSVVCCEEVCQALFGIPLETFLFMYAIVDNG